jgi:ActR/RegA family two-component response regulator
MMETKPFAIILDDDVAFNLTLSRNLERRDFETAVFDQPELFLEAARTRTPEISFVDLSINKTGDGLAVIQSLRSELKIETPILVVSGTCKKTAFERALKSGADDYIVKPINHYVLDRKISKYTHLARSTLKQSSLIPPSCIGEDAHISIDFGIKSVDEQGITFLGNHLLPKNLSFWIHGKTLEEITGSVLAQRMALTKMDYDTITGKYTYYATFDPTNTALLTAVRRWLSTHAA